MGGGVSGTLSRLPTLPNPSYDQRAFFWEGGIVYDLNTLLLPGSGWHLAQARDINNRGEIVGVGFNANGDLRGFLLSPVPDPDRYALWAVGLGVVLNGVARRARRKAK